MNELYQTRGNVIRIRRHAGNRREFRGYGPAILASTAEVSGYESKGLAFSDLKQLCAFTDGNFISHLRLLPGLGHWRI